MPIAPPRPLPHPQLDGMPAEIIHEIRDHLAFPDRLALAQTDKFNRQCWVGTNEARRFRRTQREWGDFQSSKGRSRVDRLQHFLDSCVGRHTDLTMLHTPQRSMTADAICSQRKQLRRATLIATAGKLMAGFDATERDRIVDATPRIHHDAHRGLALAGLAPAASMLSKDQIRRLVTEILGLQDRPARQRAVAAWKMQKAALEPAVFERLNV